MNAEAFFRLVERMRNAQKKCIGMRTSENLNSSKKLEKMVDDEIKRVNNILQERNCPTLFGHK